MATATISASEEAELHLRDIEPRLDASPPARSPWKLPLIRLVVALVAGAFHAAGWLFPGTWYAVWVGQAALIALGCICLPRAAFFHGMLVGVMGIGCSFYWGVQTLGETVDASKPVAVLVYAILVTFESLAFGAFCWVVAVVAKRGIGQFWIVPCAWVAIEHWFPRLFPWKLGYSQLEWIDLLQIAELVGSAGIAFVMTAVAAIPALLFLGSRSADQNGARRSGTRRIAIGYSVAASLLLIMTLLFGQVRQQQWAAWNAKQPKLKVALIQVDPAYVGSEEKLRQRSLAVHDQVDLVCWPESALGIYSESLSHFRDVDRTLELSRDSQKSVEPAKDFRSYLLAGGKLYREDASEEGPFTMAALLISPAQDVIGKYRKRTLLPLGEYVPGQNYYPSIRHWMTIKDIIEAGRDDGPLCTAEGCRLGVLICYEDMIPRNVQRTTAAGAEALFSLIQGSSFENPLTLIQHQRLAAMRAVENGRYFVRCASTGVTCIIAPTGRIEASLAPQVDGTLLGEIALFRGRTLYTRIGDCFSWACTLFCLGGFFSARACSEKRASAV